MDPFHTERKSPKTKDFYLEGKARTWPRLSDLNRVHSTADHMQLFRRSMKRFRGRQVFKAHKTVYHSTLSWRVINKKKKDHNTQLLEETMRTVRSASDIEERSPGSS